MLRNWNVLKASSLMAVAVALAPSPAPAAQNGPGEPGQTELEKLKDTLDSLSKKLDKLITNTSNGFDGVTADFNKVRADMKGLKEDSDNTKLSLDMAVNTLGKAVDRIKLLEAQVAYLKGEMDKIQKRDPSLYPPDKVGMDEIKSRLEKIEASLAKLAEARTSFSPPTNVGKIQLANMYPEPMLFVINGRNYRVEPFTTVNLENQPAGPFTYEVISQTYGLRARNTPMLEPGKTYTITVR